MVALDTVGYYCRIAGAASVDAKQSNWTRKAVIGGIETVIARNLPGYPVYVQTRDIAPDIVTSRDDYSGPDANYSVIVSRK